MQQRQLRLGDILDDYCPRERRVTNHAVVAMVGEDVKQTRCTTCDADHEYKHAKVPRQRRKSETPAALYSQVVAGAPKRVTVGADPARQGSQGPQGPVESDLDTDDAPLPEPEHGPETLNELVAAADASAASGVAGGTGGSDLEAERVAAPDDAEHDDDVEVDEIEEGPVHRPLIRATLPRLEGQAPPQRPAPDFTIRQPGGRQNRFRPRQQRAGQPFGNQSNGNTAGNHGGRSMHGRPPYGSQNSPGSRGSQGSQGAMTPRPSRHQGHQDRKRSK